MLYLIGAIAILFLIVKVLDYGSRIGRLEEQIAKLARGERVSKSATAEEESSTEPADSLLTNILAPPPAYIPTEKEHAPIYSEEVQESYSETPAPKPESYSDKETEASHKELEFKLGSKVFTVIGAIAVIFGLGFFLRYAFENNLITQTMRVILGLISGVVFLGLGEYTRRKYALYGQILTGLGVGVFYLSIYAAVNFYGLISMPLAFTGMILVTILGATLAVWNDSVALAALAQFGGFITPVLLSTGENTPHALFSYIALLNIGILAIAYWKLWRHLVVLGYVGTAILYITWYMRFYTEDQIVLAVGYATLFFFIFLGILFTQFLKKRAPQDEADLTLATINSAGYFLLSYLIINPTFPDLMGLFTALLAILHIGLGLIVASENEKSERFRYFLFGIGLVLAVLSVPIQLNKFWITIGWVAEGLVLTFLGFKTHSKNLRIFAQGVFMLAFFRLILIDGTLNVAAVPWLNSRVLTYLISVVFLSAATALYHYYREETTEDEGIIFSYLPVAAGFLMIWGSSLEIYDFFAHYWLSVSWSLVGLSIATIALALKNQALRIFGLLVFAAVFLRLIAVESYLNPAGPWLNERIFVFLVAIIAGLFLLSFYGMFGKKEADYNVAFSGLLLYVYILILWGLTNEVLDFFPQKDFWLPVIWSLGAALGGFVSLRFKNNPLQFAAIITFLISAAHLLLSEGSVNMAEYVPIINTRVFSFMVVILAAAIYVNIINYYKESLDVAIREPLRGGLYLGINFLLLFLISVEVLDFFNKQFHLLSLGEQTSRRTRYDNIKRAALSVTWMVYALLILVLGIIKKSTLARVFGVSLLGVVIFKVFLYDIANLDNFYRFVSYFTLGIILLLIGYLYNRYRSRIVEFIKVN